MSRMSVPALPAVGGALLWGTLGPAASLFGTDERLALGGIRLGIGTVTLLVLAGGRPLRRIWCRADIGPLLGGAVGVAGFQLAYFAAVGVSGVAVSTAVAIGLSPVLTGCATALRDRRAPSAGWLGGTALAVFGLALLAFAEPGAVSFAGLGLSVLAAACFSGQALAIAAMTVRHTDATALTGMFAFGAVLMIPGIAVTATPDLLSGKGIAGMLYLGVVTSGIAYWLFARGVRQLGAPAAVTISLLEPAGAAVLAAVFLGEHVSARQWVGIGLICAAVLVVGLGLPASSDRAGQLA
jgi:DME family drug/metabolite transporter